MLTFLADRGPAKRNSESLALSQALRPHWGLELILNHRDSQHTPLKHTHTTGRLSIREKWYVSDYFFLIQAKPIPENVSSKCGHYVSVGESVGESVGGVGG